MRLIKWNKPQRSKTKDWSKWNIYLPIRVCVYVCMSEWVHVKECACDVWLWPKPRRKNTGNAGRFPLSLVLLRIVPSWCILHAFTCACVRHWLSECYIYKRLNHECLSLNLFISSQYECLSPSPLFISFGPLRFTASRCAITAHELNSMDLDNDYVSVCMCFSERVCVCLGNLEKIHILSFHQ